MSYQLGKSSVAGAIVGAAMICALLPACGGTGPAPPAAMATTATPEAPRPAATPQAPPASWNGLWTGPEGTSLRIEGDASGYQITIRNLDGPRTFPGVAAGEQIQFERDGLQEVIHATNGTDTGMKWLVGKSQCLTVRTGEGYCRD